jgi:large subunit ribosomal protein L32
MLPKRRTSKARKNKRRSHHALTRPGLILCNHCNQAALPHRICGNCGWYAGRRVVVTEEK